MCKIVCKLPFFSAPGDDRSGGFVHGYDLGFMVMTLAEKTLSSSACTPPGWTQFYGLLALGGFGFPACAGMDPPVAR